MGKSKETFIEMQQELMINQDEVNELHVIYETLYGDCDNRV
tara:strand:+ start:1190 stop:1312 length:123 start_codon:yes stop_codon:yes gene_type:complete